MGLLYASKIESEVTYRYYAYNFRYTYYICTGLHGKQYGMLLDGLRRGLTALRQVRYQIPMS